MRIWMQEGINPTDRNLSGYGTFVTNSILLDYAHDVNIDVAKI